MKKSKKSKQTNKQNKTKTNQRITRTKVFFHATKTKKLRNPKIQDDTLRQGS